MSPAGEMLARGNPPHGPISFRRFMEAALYDPEYGYYRRPRDPFGKDGDFYHRRTASAGLRNPDRRPHPRNSIARWVRRSDFTVVELGAGRGEMAEAFAEWRYIPVEWLGASCRRHFAAWCSPTSSSTRCRCTRLVYQRRRLPRARVGWREIASSGGRRRARDARELGDYLRATSRHRRKAMRSR